MDFLSAAFMKVFATKVPWRFARGGAGGCGEGPQVSETPPAPCWPATSNFLRYINVLTYTPITTLLPTYQTLSTNQTHSTSITLRSQTTSISPFHLTPFWNSKLNSTASAMSGFPSFFFNVLVCFSQKLRKRKSSIRRNLRRKVLQKSILTRPSQI